MKLCILLCRSGLRKPSRTAMPTSRIDCLMLRDHTLSALILVSLIHAFLLAIVGGSDARLMWLDYILPTQPGGILLRNEAA